MMSQNEMYSAMSLSSDCVAEASIRRSPIFDFEIPDHPNLELQITDTLSATKLNWSSGRLGCFV